jgi:hypothetical protein
MFTHRSRFQRSSALSRNTKVRISSVLIVLTTVAPLLFPSLTFAEKHTPLHKLQLMNGVMISDPIVTTVTPTTITTVQMVGDTAQTTTVTLSEPVVSTTPTTETTTTTSGSELQSTLSSVATVSSPTPTTETTTVAPQTTTQTTTTVAPTTQTTTVSAPQTTQTTTSTTNSGTLCINLGYQPRASGGYDWNQIDSNFSRLKAANINCVRLDYEIFGDRNIQALAVHAKADGMYVIIGGTWGTLDSSGFSAYDAGAIAQAKWAQQNNMPQISIGNEQESRLSGITPSQFAQHLIGLASQVRQFYSGKISYEINSDFLGTWQQTGLGSIDLLGLNVYCGAGCNASRIQSAINSFGVSHVYVSETNSDMDTGNYNNDATHAADVQNNFMVLHKNFPNTPMYYFDFLAGAPWGLFDGTRYVQPLTAAVLGLK